MLLLMVCLRLGFCGAVGCVGVRWFRTSGARALFWNVSVTYREDA